MSESPEVAAAREAYAKACTACVDDDMATYPEDGEWCLSNLRPARLLKVARDAKRALDAALLAQRDRESDEEAVQAIKRYIRLPEYDAIRAHNSDPEAKWARIALKELRALGWRLVRSEPAPAPEAKASPKGQQEAVQSAKAGLYCDECGQALR